MENNFWESPSLSNGLGFLLSLQYFLPWYHLPLQNLVPIKLLFTFHLLNIFSLENSWIKNNLTIHDHPIFYKRKWLNISQEKKFTQLLSWSKPRRDSIGIGLWMELKNWKKVLLPDARIIESRNTPLHLICSRFPRNRFWKPSPSAKTTFIEHPHSWCHC